MTYRTVVVGTDGSETAQLAVRQAAELAKAFDGQLIIVSAFSDSGGATSHGEVPKDMEWSMTDAAGAEERARSGRTIAKEVGLAKVRVRVDRGDPAEVILNAADDTDADLIVVGSRGMTGSKRFVLGSVPNKVSHHSPCDLAIVHTS
jgi:nucleotide-binding universal stress UspA family protein